MEKYLPKRDGGLAHGTDGVYSSLNLGLYSYSHLTPLLLIDPDGRSPKTVARVTKAAIELATAQMPIRNMKLAGGFHPKTNVPFTMKGFPDFSKWAKETVSIKFTGNREADYKLANNAANLTETPKDFVSHHHEDGKTMQLIPKDIHEGLKMRRILGMAVAATFFLCGQVNAALVTFQYAGIVDVATTEHPEEYSWDGAVFDGFRIVSGNTVRGTLTYDTSNPVRMSTRYSGLAFYDGLAGSGGGSFEVIESGYSLRSTSDDGFQMDVGNDTDVYRDSSDFFGFTSFSERFGGELYVSLLLFDETATALATTGLPTELNFGDFTQRSFFFDLYRDGLWTQFSGTVTSVERVNDVPEPRTPFLVLAGLGLLVGSRRCRGRKARVC